MLLSRFLVSSLCSFTLFLSSRHSDALFPACSLSCGSQEVFCYSKWTMTSVLPMGSIVF
jgi:hypothetical protein